MRLRLKQVSEQPVGQYAKRILNLANTLDIPRLTEWTVQCSGQSNQKCFLLRTLSVGMYGGHYVLYLIVSSPQSPPYAPALDAGHIMSKKLAQDKRTDLK